MAIEIVESNKKFKHMIGIPHCARRHSYLCGNYSICMWLNEWINCLHMCIYVRLHVFIALEGQCTINDCQTFWGFFCICFSCFFACKHCTNGHAHTHKDCYYNNSAQMTCLCMCLGIVVWHLLHWTALSC